jgi:hypothetical protein
MDSERWGRRGRSWLLGLRIKLVTWSMFMLGLRFHVGVIVLTNSSLSDPGLFENEDYEAFCCTNGLKSGFPWSPLAEIVDCGIWNSSPLEGLVIVRLRLVGAATREK